MTGRTGQAFLIVLIAAAATAGVVARALAADPSGRGGAFTPRELDPRAVALGGAVATPYGDAASIFNNPAGLAFLGHSEARAMYDQPFGLSFLQERYASFAWSRSREDWTVDGTEVRKSGTETRPGLGIAIRALSVDLDPESYTELTTAIGCGKRWGERLGAGLTFRLLSASSDLGGVSGHGYAIDAGILMVPCSRWSVGLRLENPVGHVAWDFGGTESLPRRLEAGMTLSPAASTTLTGQLTAGDGNQTVDSYGLGLEWRFAGRLALRGGLRRVNQGSSWENSPRAGFGVMAGRIKLDYSVNDEGSFLSETHRIAVGFSL